MNLRLALLDAGLGNPGNLEDGSSVDPECISYRLQDWNFGELVMPTLQRRDAGRTEADCLAQLALREALRLTGISNEVAEADSALKFHNVETLTREAHLWHNPLTKFCHCD